MITQLFFDNKDYFEYRWRKKELDYGRTSFSKNLRAAKQGRNRPGLNYGIELPESAKPIKEYMKRVFERPSFLASLSDQEEDMEV